MPNIYSKLAICQENKASLAVKKKLEKLLFERFLQSFEFFQDFLPPVLHEEKREKFQNYVKIVHKAEFLFFLSL